MIETEMTLNLNAEEHEMINVALTHLLDAAEEMIDSGLYSIGENNRMNLLKNVRDKSYYLWSKRFEPLS